MSKIINFKNDWVDKSIPTISISEVIDMMKEPFDKDAVVERTYNKHHDNPNSEYYQMSKEDILNEWSRRGSESTHYGQLSDSYIETKLLKEDLDLEMWKLDNNYDNDKRLKNNCDSFDSFWSLFGKKYELVSREETLFWKVPNHNFYIKGRFDALFKNKETGRYVVIDWKTSKSVDKKTSPWTKKLKGPLNMYPDLNWYEYTLQVFFYKTALVESKYLPEDITLDDIDVAIVDLPGKMLPNGYNWEYNLPAFPYNETLIVQIMDFASKHKELEIKIAERKKKETEKKAKQETENETQQAKTPHLSDDLPF